MHTISTSSLALVTCASLAACKPSGNNNDAGAVSATASVAASTAPPASHDVAPAPVVTSTSAPTGPAAAGRHGYVGTIAGKAVVVRLDCTSSACGGYYFYENVGATLRLAATSVANTFEERVGAPSRFRVTGTLTMNGAPGGDAWQGSWSAPGSAQTQPIVLQKIVRRGTARWAKRTFGEKSKRSADCYSKATSFEVIGLADADLEARINAAVSPDGKGDHVFDPKNAKLNSEDNCDAGGKRCDDGVLGYRILCRDMNGRDGLYADDTMTPELIDEHVLSIRSEYGFDGGGAHPSDGLRAMTIDLKSGRIIGPHDILRDAKKEPDWEAVLPKKFGDGFDTADAHFSLAVSEESKAKLGNDRAWNDSFYVTKAGLVLIPNVGEAARIMRHSPPTVPWAKIRSSLAPQGPLAYLYAAK